MANASLEGRVVIVTGGARGLGRVMTFALLEEGAHVLIVARSADQIAQTVEDARQIGSGRCAGFAGDIGRTEDCQAAVAAAQQNFGPVQVLVNNAATGLGSWTPSGAGPHPFWTLDPEGLAAMVSVNLTGAYRMFCAAVPTMIANGFGKVITISTSRPTMRRPFVAAYGPIKAALETSTLIWAQELAGSGVTANVLLPGGVSDTALVPGKDVGNRAKPFAAGKGPLGLEGTSSELLPASIMGPPIVWLAGDGSNDISGRRFVARDWDPDLPPRDAALRASEPPADAPRIM